MFKKFLTLMGLTILSGVVVAGMAAGCVGSDPFTFGDASDDAGDAGGDSSTDSSGNVDAGKDSGSSGNGGTTACYSAGDVKVLPATATAEYPPKQCTATEVNNVKTACIDPATATHTTCSNTSLSAGCFNCLIGSDQSTDVPIIFSVGQLDYVNDISCLAIQLGTPQCAVPLSNLFFCALNACQSCTKDDDANNCADQAVKTGGCSSIYTGLTNECQSTLSAINALQAGDAAYVACKGNGDSTSVFQATATALCVTGAPK